MKPIQLVVYVAMFVAAIAVAYTAAPRTTVNDPTEAPTIDAPCFVDAGSSLSGHADDCDAPIDVEATWDDTGLDVSGSPDPGGFGTRNVFDFATTTADAGRSFTIRATDGKGNYIEKVIDVL